MFADQRAGKMPREYPNGRVAADDDGAILFKVGSDPIKQLVQIEYAEPTRWVAMKPEEAIELAQMLIKHARSVSAKPLTVVLH